MKQLVSNPLSAGQAKPAAIEKAGPAPATPRIACHSASRLDGLNPNCSLASVPVVSSQRRHPGPFSGPPFYTGHPTALLTHHEQQGPTPFGVSPCLVVGVKGLLRPGLRPSRGVANKGRGLDPRSHRDLDRDRLARIFRD